MEEQEQTQDEQKSLTLQQKFEEELQTEEFKNLRWRQVPELGLVLHDSDRFAFQRKFHIIPGSKTIDMDHVLSIYNEGVAR